MNQLFRGVEKSRCYLRVSRQAFSTSESASVVSAQNLIAQQAESNRRSYQPVTLGHICAHQFLRNDSTVLHRNFSSLSAATVTDTVESDAGEKQSISTTRPLTRDDVINRRPSALERAKLKVVTPGHAIFVLQKHAAGGIAMIRQSDFVLLCESSRPGKKTDAKVIATALKEFNLVNRFVLQRVGARAAVDGMLRSGIPTWKVQDGKPRVQAAVFVAQQILDEKTGMYFALETTKVDTVLKELHKGILEMEENGIKLEAKNRGDKPNDDDKLLREALRVTGEVVQLLVKRKSRPENALKKRAKRKYLKRLQIGGGPYNSTLRLATQISILIGGSAVAQKNIVDPYDKAWWTKRVVPDVLRMIEEASEMELEKKKSVEAAEAKATEEAEGDDVEDDESNAEDGDGDDDQEEGDSQTEVVSEEEKKD
mmetsp:Transcript_34758/g.62571  ORF Transcript_34758/g.62571 Transcript_34758/m.62571 type:complete len:425 (+) Transcript_34758:80-1354(+)